MTRCSITAIFIGLGSNISLRKKSKCMESAFAKKNTGCITRIFFVSIGPFCIFFPAFSLFKADFTKVLSLRTQLASVSNYFVLFPTIFCLFQRMVKVCLAHKSVRERQQKGTMQIYKCTNGRSGYFSLVVLKNLVLRRKAREGGSFFCSSFPLCAEDLGVYTFSIYFW